MLLKFLLTSILLLVMPSVMALNIVATIPPLASMVNPLLTDRDDMTVLLTPGHTPHGFQLKPSHMIALEKADVILAVGTGVDGWAAKALERWPEKVITMTELPGLVKLKMRHHSDWKINLIEEGHKHKPSHFIDPHVWLLPDNARLLIKAFEKSYLKTLNTESSRAEFKLRSQEYLTQLKEVDLNIKQQLASVSMKPFVVLHDAFQYFQLHYQLNGVGAIQVSPKLKPSLNRVIAMQKLIKERGVVCVFKEPQFPDNQIDYLVRGLDVRIGSLDPLGGRVENERYDVFIQDLANQFKSCLR